MPSIARHLGITIPREQLMEMDGVPLTGKISATGLQSSLKNGRLQLQWKAIDKEGSVKIWVTTTNHFKTGGIDKYRLIGTVPVAQENFQTGTTNLPRSDFYKVVLETPHNS